jgi:hypothetical protein
MTQLSEGRLAESTVFAGSGCGPDPSAVGSARDPAGFSACGADGQVRSAHGWRGAGTRRPASAGPVSGIESNAVVVRSTLVDPRVGLR